MRGRRPTAEEMALWGEVARTVRPLPSSSPEPEPPSEPPSPPAASAVTGATGRPHERRASGDGRGTVADALDRRTAQRLRRGRLPIEAKIDLHGHSQASAHAALLRFLSRARADGCRYALVVTGRGSEGGGILRRSVPRWLEEPAFHRHVVGHHEAGPKHGGAGALYVVLRRGPR